LGRALSPYRAVRVATLGCRNAFVISPNFAVPPSSERRTIPLFGKLSKWAPPSSRGYCDYHGSYLLVFAGYNAGHGQVEKWIEGYGNPRDPKIDWVERIPFAETRNYFQRIMENLRAYPVRFGSGTQWQQPAKMSN
jgi:hypothetical protein